MKDYEKQMRLFHRAADQRLTTAEFLLEHEFYLDAVYLAGYAVECAMKALALRWTPRNEWERVLGQVTEAGAKGHNFEYLKNILKERRRGKNRTDREILGVLTVHLRKVAAWSTDLRYEVGTLKPREAEEFFAAAKAIRDACARS